MHACTDSVFVDVGKRRISFLAHSLRTVLRLFLLPCFSWAARSSSCSPFRTSPESEAKDGRAKPTAVQGQKYAAMVHFVSVSLCLCRALIFLCLNIVWSHFLSFYAFLFSPRPPNPKRHRGDISKPLNFSQLCFSKSTEWSVLDDALSTYLKPQIIKWGTNCAWVSVRPVAALSFTFSSHFVPSFCNATLKRKGERGKWPSAHECLNCFVRRSDTWFF